MLNRKEGWKTTQFISVFNDCSCGCVLSASMSLALSKSVLCLVSVVCSDTASWIFCSRVSFMYSEILVGM